MQGPVYTELAPVRKRQQWLFALRTTSHALLTGAILGLGLELTRRWTGWSISGTAIIAVLLGFPLLGFLIGLVWQRTWFGAAVAVDAHYQLKDRAATALAFLAKSSNTDLHRLQIHDAAEHLARVEPQQVVPLRLPRSLAVGASFLLVAMVMLFWPLRPQVVEGSTPEPLPAVLAEAQRIEEDLKEFEDLARKENSQELKDLVQEMERLVEQMKQPGIDEREALAKLSEMEAAIVSKQAEFNVGLVDGQLQALGEAFSAASATDSAGKALQESKYDKAAKELEQMEDPQFDRKEAKALEEKLKQVAQSMGEVGLGQLSGAVSEFAEGLKGGKSSIKKATREIGKAVRGQERRKRINDILNGELARLQDSKSNFQGNSTAKGKNPQKSLSPTSNWGMGTSGNVQGEKTSMLAQRNMQELTGNPGDGPSDIETTHSAEGRQQAARALRNVNYDKYKRMSETVLDSEPIPLGHRQTIRRYFELIRPQNADGMKESTDRKDAATPKK